MSSAHDAPPAPAAPQPAGDLPEAPRRSPAEEARTLLAVGRGATLGTLSEDGGPWASLVSYAVLEDGSPVVWLSTLAEHGRNLQRDQRASLMVADPAPPEDALATGRVTLAGRVERASGELYDRARAAYLATHGARSDYDSWGDFTLWVLRVERVRWVGGYGRMSSASALDYAAAAPDPVQPSVAGAVEHLNADHADALLAIVQALGGFPQATAARCDAVDRYGMDLVAETPEGRAWTRVAWAERIDLPAGLRAASVTLTRAAREALIPAD